MKIEILEQKYELIENYKDAFVLEDIQNKYTDYFNSYDYILGDYAYGKLRLKGFNNAQNPNFNKINDFESIKNYIKNNCAYDCKYFILKKL